MTRATEEPPRRSRARSSRRRSKLERLLDRAVLGPTHPELGTCWLFTGTTTPYGRIAKAQDSYTHRLGWKLLRGPIPEGKELHHRCGVYACWNPDHLEVVTHAQNLAYKRKTHCRRGHLLSSENLRINPRTGTRACRACLRENQRRLRAEASRRATQTIQDRTLGRPGRPPGWDDPAVLRVGCVLTWSDSWTVPSLADPIRSWAPAGSSPGQLIPMGVWGKGLRGSSTG
jgi:HNH endonuclease